ADEKIGVVLLFLALAALTLLVLNASRIWLSQARVQRVLNACTTSAEPWALPDFPIPAYKIDAVFPIVAVVGVLRPRLIVARSVLDALSDEEFAAVLGHERAHLTKQDNARRALMASTTDILTWFSLSKQINSAWHEATEQSADDTISVANSR